MMKFFLWIVLCFLNTILVAATTDSVVEKYPLLINKPDSVGECFMLNSTVNRTILAVSRLASGKMEEQTTYLTTLFKAKIKVLAVDQRNQATRVEATILEMKSKDPNRPEVEIFDKNTIIVAELKKDKTVFTSFGFSMTQVQSAELALFINLAPAKISDQLIFGSIHPRAVGETWSINPHYAATLLGDDFSFPQQMLKGKAQFVSLDSQIATLNGEIDAQNIPITFNIQQIDKSSLDVKIKYKTTFPLIPATDKKYTENLIIRMTVSIDARDENGAPFNTRQTTIVSQSATIN